MNDGKLYDQETDLEIINKLIPNLTHKSFLDIGAEKGTFAASLIHLGLNGFLFEPLPKHEEELKALVKNTKSTFFNYAIDSIDREAHFHIACDENDQPLDYFHSLQKLTNDTRINHKQTLSVQCRSLNSLAKENLIPKQIGLLKMDTEGNDLNVLKGMSDIEAEILVCEYFMPGIYAGWEQGHPRGIIDEAKKLGFHHFMAIKRVFNYEFLSLDNPSFCDKQWGNLIFIKDSIFTIAEPILKKIIAEKENTLHQSIINYTELLQNEVASLRTVCEERLVTITNLDAACKARQKVIEEMEVAQISPKKRNLKNLLKNFISKAN